MKQITKIHFELKFDETLKYESYDSLKKNVKRRVRERLKYDESETIDDGQVIYYFIQKKISENFSNKSGYDVVLTDYSEREGSFIVGFSLAIIGAISNYESFKRSFESFVDDLRDSLLFYDQLFNCRVMFNEEFGHINNNKSLVSNNTLSKVKSFWPILFLLFSVIGIFDDEIFNHFNNKASFESQKYSFNGINDYEHYIEKQVKEEIAQINISNSKALLDRELRQAELERDTVKQELIEELQSQLGISND
ncbi:MAG: hypothetical protein ACK4EY_15430 [Flavipsychrobacter sp.]